jgi:hypothetical protein
LIGPRLRQASGAKEQVQRERFEKWFIGLLDLYVDAAR